MIQENIVDLLEKTIKIFEKDTQLMFLTIFPTHEAPSIKDFIKGIRYEGIDHIIFNLFEKTQ